MRLSDARDLSRQKKDEILERDCYICAYCDGDASVVDHVIPWSWSKCDDEYNLVASCEHCNAIAHNLVFDSFTQKRAYIRKKLNRKRASIPNQRAICARCHAPMRITDRKATNIICGDCNQDDE